MVAFHFTKLNPDSAIRNKISCFVYGQTNQTLQCKWSMSEGKSFRLETRAGSTQANLFQSHCCIWKSIPRPLAIVAWSCFQFLCSSFYNLRSGVLFFKERSSKYREGGYDCRLQLLWIFKQPGLTKLKTGLAKRNAIYIILWSCWCPGTCMDEMISRLCWF